MIPAIAASTAALLTVVLAACESPPVTTTGPASPPIRDAGEVLRMVETRGDAIERFDARLELALRRADGAAADLSGTLRMERPDRFRLRSTKFGFLVCDVVLCDGDAWALMSPVVREQAQATAEATAALLRVLGSLLGWRDDRAGDLVVVEERPFEVLVRASEPEGTSLVWTLTRDNGRVLEVCRLENERTIGTLRCFDHEIVEGVPVPRRLRFESETGTIEVRVHRPRFDEPPPADAFTAPEGAERIAPSSRERPSAPAH